VVVAAQMLKRAPWWTIGLVTAAVAALVIPGVKDVLIYDRGALAHGEWWRLLTAHVVHFSGAHLFNNLLVFALAAYLVETRYRDDFARILGAAAAVIGIALVLFEPGVHRFAGASGLSIALLTYAMLRGLQEERRWRTVCAVVLSILAAKLIAECLLGWQLTDWEPSAGFVTVPLSHAAGAGAGLGVWLRFIWRRAGRRGVRLAQSCDHVPDRSMASSTGR
jgi:rhomboid family GlyGly-CTERM serine protease